MTRRRLLCILYLSIWLVYGFAYWITANVTNGEAFVFNSDLLLNIHIDKISKELGYDFPKKYLKEIIVNDLKCYYSHDFVSFNPIYLMQGMSKSKCSIPISILTTYELINDGETHFKISKYIDNTKESKLFF